MFGIKLMLARTHNIGQVDKIQQPANSQLKHLSTDNYQLSTKLTKFKSTNTKQSAYFCSY
jgi:hypothetical protein